MAIKTVSYNELEYLHDATELEYLHDATVSSVLWDCSDPKSRCLTFQLIANEDCGFELWEGRSLRICLNDITVFQFEGFGVIGAETIDSWRSEISSATKMKWDPLAESGIRLPKHYFTITFHSGSYIEVGCEEVMVHCSGGSSARECFAVGAEGQ